MCLTLCSIADAETVETGSRQFNEVAHCYAGPYSLEEYKCLRPLDLIRLRDKLKSRTLIFGDGFWCRTCTAVVDRLDDLLCGCGRHTRIYFRLYEGIERWCAAETHQANYGG
jgi:hypothetical protein